VLLLVPVVGGCRIDCSFSGHGSVQYCWRLNGAVVLVIGGGRSDCSCCGHGMSDSGCSDAGALW